MAAGFFKKAMVYLGLVDDEYDDYEDYEPRAPVAPRVATRVPAPAEEPEEPRPTASGGTIRTLSREENGAAAVTGSITPRPAQMRAKSPETAARVHVIAPAQFGDARHIADRLMANQPVIVNLQVADRELMRRMIDFCSGATYALNGKMERVADKVFLLTPSNVKVSAEERQRLQENGLLRT
jgi:cell division inhibitor SepF